MGYERHSAKSLRYEDTLPRTKFFPEHYAGASTMLTGASGQRPRDLCWPHGASQQNDIYPGVIEITSLKASLLAAARRGFLPALPGQGERGRGPAYRKRKR